MIKSIILNENSLTENVELKAGKKNFLSATNDQNQKSEGDREPGKHAHTDDPEQFQIPDVIASYSDFFTMKTIFYFFVVAAFINGACKPTQKQEADIPSVQQTAIRETTFKVEGMTCDHCEMSIRKGVEELNGITSVEANHEDSTTHVAYDPTKTGEEEIIAAIEKRGYKVIQNN